MLSIKSLLFYGVFLFGTVVIAAFTYLAWYQACFVIFLAFLFLSLAGFRLIVSRLESLAVQVFDVKSQVLRNATADIHSVRPIEPPQEDLQPLVEDGEFTAPPDLRWYEVEFTIFPDSKPKGRMTHWDVDDLRFVPLSAQISRDVKGEEPEDEIAPTSVLLIENGMAIEPTESKFRGPQRLRMTVGFPKGIHDWKLRYYFESFGHIRLQAAFT